MTKLGEWDGPHFYWRDRSSDMRTAYAYMRGRMTAAEFVEGLRQLAPDVSLEQIGITFGTAKWSRPATAEELADRAVHNARNQEKTEEWERAIYVQLKAKFAALDGEQRG